MDDAAAEEKLKFVMACIMKTKLRKRLPMAGITIG